MRSRTFGILLCAAWAAFAAQAEAQSAPPLRLVQTIALPGVEGRIDHLAVDATGQRLFVAALGNNTLEVVDLRAGKRTHSLGGLHEPQGVAYAPESQRLFVANGQDGACLIFDARSLRPLGRVAFSEDADNVRYDAKGHIFVGYGAGAIGIVEAASGKRLGDWRLAGHPESFQLEANGTRIYVNVPTADHIAVRERNQKGKVTTWPLRGARANFPMALDEADHRLFIGCRDPAKLLVYDTKSGREITRLDIGGDTDDVFYDAAHKRLYVSCGAGVLDVFRQNDPDHYTAMAHLPTAAGARTSLYVPTWARLYLAVPHRGRQQAEIRVYAAQP
jgi:hypothetical protein